MSSLESPPSPHLPPSPPVTIPTETNSISTAPSPRPHSSSLTAPSDTRIIRARDTDPSYGDNALRSAKYSYATMLPKAIYEQFRRLSNFYFLIVAAVSFIPDVSPSSPATTTLPLIVVVGFGLARDIYEDLGRKKDDKKRNSRPIIIRKRERLDRQQNHPPPSVLSTPDSDGFFQTESHLPPDDHTPVRSQDILVGDVVLVRRDEEFPADMLLLHVAGDSPVCYASTANLDGESNLKRMLVPPPLHSTVTASHKLSSLYATVHASQPTASLYDFQGSLLIDGHPPCPLSTPNLLLRGSILRNSEYIYGLVLYNGPETKVALNMRHPPSKLGGVERMMNRVVIGLFSMLMLVTILTSVLAGIWQNSSGEGQWYMGDFREDSGAKVALRSLGTFLILFHTFVPVSLFVTLEFARIIQGIFIHADTKMRTRDTPVVVKANNLNESLGYIEHIFSDKTGTLTENVMRFLACSAGDSLFDLGEDSLAIRNAVDNRFQPICNLLLAMGLCHSVVPERSSSINNQQNKHYQGESPDEVALVEAARDSGVELCERNLHGLVLRSFARQSTDMYEVLADLEFSSERKRSSVIVRCPDGRIMIYTKGADSVMADILPTSVSYATQVDHYADLFARRGLRTLVYACRELSEEEYEPWAAAYADASNSLSNRSAKQADLAMAVERNLDLLGVTAVEDKLQRNVPATIRFLRQAGLRIWVLTGDKRETAENIGYSSQLLSRDMNVFHIQVSSAEELLYRLEVIELSMSKGFDVGEVIKPPDNNAAMPTHKRSSSMTENIVAAITLRSSAQREEKELAIIIDGASLAFVEGEELELAFLKVASACKTVICARVTPLQKAAVVKMVRRHQHSNTLAIGDGGNDVSMIQEAHVGIGIIGKEGSQAARAADYSMGEFRHLARLLAVHGRFSYIRTTGVINLSFYKNIFFSFTQFLFQLYCFASGTTFHDQWVVTAWNSAITLLPPFFYGIFERDLEESTVLRFPSVYKTNWNNRLFSLRTVMEFTLAYSVWHGLVVFFGTLAFFGSVPRINFTSGQDGGFYLTGLAVTTMAVPIALSKFLLVTHLWTNITVVGSLVSFALLWLLIPVFVNLAHEAELEGVLSMLFSSPNYHLLWPIVFVSAFLPDFLVIVRRFSRPTNVVGQLQVLEVKEKRAGRRMQRVERKDIGREQVWESASASASQ